MFREILISIGLTLFDWYCKASREINFISQKYIPYIIPSTSYAFFYGNANVTNSVNAYLSVDNIPSCKGLHKWLYIRHGDYQILTIVKQYIGGNVIEKNNTETCIDITHIDLANERYIKRTNKSLPILFGKIDVNTVNNQMELNNKIVTNKSGELVNYHMYEPENSLPVKLDDDDLDDLVSQL